MRFAELEYCLQSYFDGKLVPMMKQVQDTLANKKVDEKGRYQSSLAGIKHQIGRASCRERV